MTNPILLQSQIHHRPAVLQIVRVFQCQNLLKKIPGAARKSLWVGQPISNMQFVLTHPRNRGLQDLMALHGVQCAGLG